jgi:8-oxo-dGTP pyrophosphatase MutT (NUDIX family)
MKRIIDSFDVYSNRSGDNFWGDLAAGVIPIAQDTKRILLNLRSKFVNEPLTFGIWGGKLDSGERDLKEAAIREFREETHYKGPIRLIKAHLFKTPNNSFQYQNFIGIVNKEFTPHLDWESEGFEWVSYQQLLEMLEENPHKIHFGLKTLLKESKEDVEKIILNH